MKILQYLTVYLQVYDTKLYTVFTDLIKPKSIWYDIYVQIKRLPGSHILVEDV